MLNFVGINLRLHYCTCFWCSLKRDSKWLRVTGFSVTRSAGRNKNYFSKAKGVNPVLMRGCFCSPSYFTITNLDVLRTRILPLIPHESVSAEISNYSKHKSTDLQLWVLFDSFIKSKHIERSAKARKISAWKKQVFTQIVWILTNWIDWIWYTVFIRRNFSGTNVY